MLYVFRDRWEFPRLHLRIVEEIGRGAFGEVFKAVANNLGGVKGQTVVALKQAKRGGGCSWLIRTYRSKNRNPFIQKHRF